MDRNNQNIIEKHLGKRKMPENSVKFLLVEVDMKNSDILDNIPEVKIIEEMPMSQEMIAEVGGPTLYIP